jgi:UPF0271 protein
VHYQIAALFGMAGVQNITVEYVKPHGALYNDMMQNSTLRKNIMQAVADYPADLSLMLQATPDYETHKKEAGEMGVVLLFEAFADRCYTDQGALVSRAKPHAVLDEAAMMLQVSRLIKTGEIISDNGKVLAIPVDTLCIHGDNETAVEHLEHIRALVDAG